MTINAVLVDDILGQAEDPKSSYGREGFQATHGGDRIRFTFINPFDEFLTRFDSQAALDSIEALEKKPDIFLIDLVYGEGNDTGGQLHMGLEIVDALATSPRFSDVPRALFTTGRKDDAACGSKFEGRTIAEVLEDSGTHYINKDQALDAGLYEALLPVVEG